MADNPKQRITYLDWMRGLACLVMLQGHCYDSWLGGANRESKFFQLSQLGGTLPAPLFLFLAGVSCALVTDRRRQKGHDAGGIARTMIRRGAQIFGLGLLFRLQECLLGRPYAPWTDLLRVDILNLIGLSLILLGAACRVVALGKGMDSGGVPPDAGQNNRFRARCIALAAAVAAAIALLTPPLWTTHRPRWLPWYLESYINGVHISDAPQPWFFPVFPWMAFAFAGLAVGFLLAYPWSLRHQLKFALAAGAAGVAMIALGLWFDALPFQLYAVYDFWHTSPNFFLTRVGVLLAVVLIAFAWCRWGAAKSGFSPMIEMGQSSFLIYWVHTEFVYGRYSILDRGEQDIADATFGLVMITAAMVLLAFVRNRTKGRSLRQIFSQLREVRGAS